MSLTSFIPGKTTRGLGESSASKAMEHCSGKIWDRCEFYRALEEAVRKQGMIG